MQVNSRSKQQLGCPRRSVSLSRGAIRIRSGSRSKIDMSGAVCRRCAWSRVDCRVAGRGMCPSSSRVPFQKHRPLSKDKIASNPGLSTLRVRSLVPARPSPCREEWGTVRGRSSPLQRPTKFLLGGDIQWIFFLNTKLQRQPSRTNHQPYTPSFLKQNTLTRATPPPHRATCPNASAKTSRSTPSSSGPAPTSSTPSRPPRALSAKSGRRSHGNPRLLQDFFSVHPTEASDG